MRGSKLDIIRQYCDTEGMRLRESDKDLLCMILENPYKYDGFKSKVHEDHGDGRDPYKGRYSTTTQWQYRINIGSKLSIDMRRKHACDDGYLDVRYWSWDNPIHITNVKQIIKILHEIEYEL